MFTHLSVTEEGRPIPDKEGLLGEDFRTNMLGAELLGEPHFQSYLLSELKQLTERIPIYQYHFYYSTYAYPAKTQLIVKK